MSDDAFEWRLTPTERRIAEMAFANENAGAWLAVEKIMHLRGERGPWNDGVERCAAMLAELRREPAAEDHSAKRAGELLDALAIATERDRYRALLERIVKAVDNRGLDFVDSNSNDLLDALDDARKELGR